MSVALVVAARVSAADPVEKLRSDLASRDQMLVGAACWLEFAAEDLTLSGFQRTAGQCAAKAVAIRTMLGIRR